MARGSNACRHNTPTSGWSRFFSTCWRPSAAPAQNTLAAYGRDLADFTAYLHGRERSVAAATTDDVRAYLGDLASRADAAGDGGAAALGDPPALSLSLCRRPAQGRSGRGARRSETRPRLPKMLTLAEVDRLLAARRPMRSAGAVAMRLRAARLACLVELLYATGLRVSELVSLPASAARRDARVIVVRGKGNKERLVPLNDAAKRAMAEYLALARKRAAAEAASKWLFPSFGDSGHLTRQHFARELKALAAAAGLRAGAAQPARAAPRLRQPPPAQWRRPARGADAARPCRHLDHADLYPCAGGAAEKPGPRFASADGRQYYDWIARLVCQARHDEAAAVEFRGA